MCKSAVGRLSHNSCVAQGTRVPEWNAVILVEMPLNGEQKLIAVNKLLLTIPLRRDGFSIRVLMK
jgi:hypothetical protein